MSTLQCANIHLESTANNRIQFVGSNTIAIVTSGSNAMIIDANDNATLFGTLSMTTSFLRNRIINGDMRIDQRNAGASVSSGINTLTYTVDRWSVATTGAAVTAQRQGTVGNYNLTVTGAASVTACNIRQRIEALNIADLAGQTVTVSFSCSSSTLSSIFVGLSHANSYDNHVGQTSIASSSINITSTLTRYSFTATLPANAANGVELAFGLGAFTSGNFVLTNVQLEPGSIATPFERRSYGQEFFLCERYFQHVGGGWTGMEESTTFYSMAFSYRTPMRTGPTITLITANVNTRIPSISVDRTIASTLSTYSSTVVAAWVGLTCSGGNVQGRFIQNRDGGNVFYANSEL